MSIELSIQKIHVESPIPWPMIQNITSSSGIRAPSKPGGDGCLVGMDGVGCFLDVFL